MSVNSSSSSLPLLSLSSSNSSDSFDCFVFSGTSAAVIAAFSVTKALLLLPLFLLILFLGFRRWRRQRSGASASHSDVITYHVIGTEVIYFLASVLFCFAVYMDCSRMMRAAQFILSLATPAAMLFQTLVCVERYLAVVHPITYVGLRNSGGVRIRNLSIGCVWLLCAGWMSVSLQGSLTPLFSLLAVSVIVTSFCSFSVLRALKRAGPGRERVDQSKKRAFYIIVALVAVLLFWLVGYLVTSALSTSKLFNSRDSCTVLVSGIWFRLPSSLVLPLLFVQKAGKLQCCNK